MGAGPYETVRGDGLAATRLKPGLQTSDDEPTAADAPSTPASRSPRVRGRVVDESGRPIADATYSLPQAMRRCYRNGECFPETRVTPDGAIDWSDNCSLLHPGDSIRLVVRAAGFAPQVGSWRGLDADIDVGTIVLARGERIEGVVRDDEGRRAPAVEVRLVPDSDEADETWIAGQGASCCSWKTDDAGNFKFDTLQPGRYRLRVELPDAPPATVVVAGALDAVLVVPRAALPRRVDVKVVALDADGAPFRGDADASLHGGGRVVSEALVEGRAAIEIGAAVGAELAVRDWDTDEQFIFEDVATRDEPYVVQFGRSPTIRGRVVADPGARPVDVRELRVAAISEDGDSRSVAVRDDWTFTVAVPVSGRYLLTTDGNGDDPCARRWATTGGGDVELRLPATSSLERIEVAPRLPDGVVATWIESRAVDAAGEIEWRTCGSFDRLPPGRTWRVTVRVKAGGDWFGPTTLDGVRSGGPPIDVPLAPSPTIDGVVVRRDGTLVVRAKVQAWSKAASLVEGATTGLDGRFRLVGLAPGEWTLTAETDALETSPRLVVAAGSRDVRVVATPRRAPF